MVSAVRRAVIGAVLAAAVVVGAVPSASAASAGADPGVWAARTCRALVDVQAAGLDARDALWAAAAGAAPTDRASRRELVKGLRRALTPAVDALDALDGRLAKAPPRGAQGTDVRDRLRSGYAAVDDAYADATTGVRALADVAPVKMPAATARVLARLDRATDRATPPITRVERTLRRSSVATPFTTVAICRSIGPEWSFVSDADAEGRTPKPDPAAAGLPGAVDLTAPALLLPGRYRPPAAIAALGAKKTMPGIGRTFLYGAVPVVETGEPFVGDCP